jgi:hypothetical protein
MTMHDQIKTQYIYMYVRTVETIMKDEILLEGQVYETGGALSARLGVCSVTIYRWVRRGLLPTPIKIGTRKYYCRDEVESRLSQGQ